MLLILHERSFIVYTKVQPKPICARAYRVNNCCLTEIAFCGLGCAFLFKQKLNQSPSLCVRAFCINCCLTMTKAYVCASFVLYYPHESSTKVHLCTCFLHNIIPVTKAYICSSFVLYHLHESSTKVHLCTCFMYQYYPTKANLCASCINISKSTQSTAGLKAF